MSNASFRQLIRQVQHGDARACENLVRDYGPVILREARMRLGPARGRGLLDSQDVCQSVLKSFLARVVKGEYQLQQPAQLIGLLVSMTRHKAIDGVRREARRRVAYRSHDTASGRDAIERIACDGDSPEQLAIARELMNQYRRQLVEDEWYLFERRMQGYTWSEIATEIGESAEAIRKRFRRALDRVGAVGD